MHGGVDATLPRETKENGFSGRYARPTHHRRNVDVGPTPNRTKAATARDTAPDLRTHPGQPRRPLTTDRPRTRLRPRHRRASPAHDGSARTPRVAVLRAPPPLLLRTRRPLPPRERPHGGPPEPTRPTTRRMRPP